jgi:hypothetical protein
MDWAPDCLHTCLTTTCIFRACDVIMLSVLSLCLPCHLTPLHQMRGCCSCCSTGGHIPHTQCPWDSCPCIGCGRCICCIRGAGGHGIQQPAEAYKLHTGLCVELTWVWGTAAEWELSRQVRCTSMQSGPHSTAGHVVQYLPCRSQQGVLWCLVQQSHQLRSYPTLG